MQDIKLILNIKKALSLLNKEQKSHLYKWFFISLMGSSLKAFGVVSIMPFVALMNNPELIETHSFFIQLNIFFSIESYNEFLLLFAGFTIFVFVMASMYSIFEVWYGYKLANKLERELSVRLFEIYASQNYSFFLKQQNVESIRRVTQEIEVGLVSVIMTTVEIVSNILLTLFILSFLIYINPFIAFISVIILFLSHLLVEYFIGKKISRLGIHFTNLNDSLLKTATEMFSGIKEVKILSAEKKFTEQYSRDYEKLSYYSVRYGILEYLPREILESIAYISIIVLSIVTITYYERPEAVFPFIAIYAMAIYRLIPALREIFSGIEDIHLSEYSLSKIDDDFSLNNQQQKVYKDVSSVQFRYSLELKNITFAYSKAQKLIFNQFNHKIKAGDFIFVSGPSGIGKTTFADIIMGFVEPFEGVIIVDNQEINKSNISYWRELIGYVPQSVFLFQGNVAQNVAMATDISDMRVIKKCCDIAQISEEIENLSEGYQTKLGQGSLMLSGGQLKRLGIARALYKKPQLLILDESTNEIEQAKKIKILSELKAIKDLTVILISHDIDIATKCEQVINL